MKTNALLASTLLLCGATNEPVPFRVGDGVWIYETSIRASTDTNHLFIISPHWQLETNWVDAEEWDFFNYFFNERMVKFPGCDPDYRAALDTWGKQWIRQRERGTVTSNLLAVIEWKQKRFTNVLESITVTNLTRSYVEKTVREYKP